MIFFFVYVHYSILKFLLNLKGTSVHLWNSLDSMQLIFYTTFGRKFHSVEVWRRWESMCINRERSLIQHDFPIHWDGRVLILLWCKSLACVSSFLVPIVLIHSNSLFPSFIPSLVEGMAKFYRKINLSAKEGWRWCKKEREKLIVDRQNYCKGMNRGRGKKVITPCYTLAKWYQKGTNIFSSRMLFALLAILSF